MTEKRKPLLDIQSEIGELEAVMIHTPGAEIENMLPINAHKALYSDILNLSVARVEYAQLRGILQKVSHVYEVDELLVHLLGDEKQKQSLVHKICTVEKVPECESYLIDMQPNILAKALLEGVKFQERTLTNFLADDHYALHPLYNYYFTRDASVIVGHNAVICKMANSVRVRESIINNAIFSSGMFFDTVVVDSCFSENPALHFEGGDILVVRDDILLVGKGVRSSAEGIDCIIKRLCREGEGVKHIIVQQLPSRPESFIHLDMVFTMLDRDKAMVYKPLILDKSQYRTIYMKVDNGRVVDIHYVDGIIQQLNDLGMDVEPIVCGGADTRNQEREQWHSGANFVAIAPGKVVAYARNIYTLDELNRHGFEIVPAADVINDKVDLASAGKCVITISGSELSRGGGGARCMTMPLRRKAVEW